MELQPVPDPAARRDIWVVEDEPAAAELARELCEACGCTASLFTEASAFLAALRTADPPAAAILDWRLERELSSALFLAVRHRQPRLPVIYWTGSTAISLPEMIRADERARIVEKADGADAFERALEWALSPDAGP